MEINHIYIYVKDVHRVEEEKVAEEWYIEERVFMYMCVLVYIKIYMQTHTSTERITAPTYDRARDWR